MRRFLAAMVVFVWLAGVALGARADVIEVEAGPIWNQSDAQGKCPRVCGSKSRAWDGNWHTTREGSMSVCNCSSEAVETRPHTSQPTAMPIAPQFNRQVAAPAGTVLRYSNTDFFSNDISRADADSFEACASRCIAEQRCVAFTLSPGHTCYLKSSVGLQTKVSSAESGFIAGRGTPPAPRDDGATQYAAPNNPSPGVVGGANACSVGGTARCPGCSVSCPAGQRPACTTPIEGIGGICQRESACRCE